MARRLTYEYVYNFLKERDIILLSETYESSNELLKLECKCGNIFYRNFKNIRNGKFNCPTCTWENRSVGYENVKKFVESKGCKLLSNKYINNSTKLKIQCSCGGEFEIRFADFKFKERYKCNNCRKKKNYTYDDVKKFIESKGCKLISETYIKNNEYLTIQCSCGEIFSRKFNSFKDSKQYYCNKCSCKISIGERIIMEFLRDNNIAYNFQHKFLTCKNQKKLSFDFYLPNYNMCIEFDGRQHFEVVNAFGGEKELEKCKLRDSIKDKYCKEQQIKLLRIPYWDIKNINEILQKNLNIQ